MTQSCDDVNHTRRGAHNEPVKVLPQRLSIASWMPDASRECDCAMFSTSTSYSALLCQDFGGGGGSGRADALLERTVDGFIGRCWTVVASELLRSMCGLSIESPVLTRPWKVVYFSGELTCRDDFRK